MKIRFSFSLEDSMDCVGRLARCEYRQEDHARLMQSDFNTLVANGAEHIDYMPRGRFSGVGVWLNEKERHFVDLKKVTFECTGSVFDDCTKNYFYVEERDHEERAWYYEPIEVSGEFDPGKLVIRYKRMLEPVFSHSNDPVSNCRLQAEIAEERFQLRQHLEWDGEVRTWKSEVKPVGYALVDQISYDGVVLKVKETYCERFSDRGDPIEHFVIGPKGHKWFKEIYDFGSDETNNNNQDDELLAQYGKAVKLDENGRCVRCYGI